MAAGSYAYLGEAEVVGAATALLGEVVVGAAVLEGKAAAAAAAAFEGEAVAAAAAAAAGGAAAAAAAGSCVPIILAIGSIAPALRLACCRLRTLRTADQQILLINNQQF